MGPRFWLHRWQRRSILRQDVPTVVIHVKAHARIPVKEIARIDVPDHARVLVRAIVTGHARSHAMLRPPESTMAAAAETAAAVAAVARTAAAVARTHAGAAARVRARAVVAPPARADARADAAPGVRVRATQAATRHVTLHAWDAPEHVWEVVLERVCTPVMAHVLRHASV